MGERHNVAALNDGDRARFQPLPTGEIRPEQIAKGAQMAEAKANISGSAGPTVERDIESKSNPGRGPSQPNLLAVTISADTGEVVKVEKVEGTGVRRDLQDSDQMKTRTRAMRARRVAARIAGCCAC